MPAGELDSAGQSLQASDPAAALYLPASHDAQSPPLGHASPAIHRQSSLAASETTADGFPRHDKGVLFGKMMLAIRTSHTWGNRVRMLKLPLILTDMKLYAGAIANFYWLTRALELALASKDKADDPILAPVRALGLRLTEGYEADLAELFGEDSWQAAATRARTRVTEAYVTTIEAADSVQLVAASFILYGALVIGGGKQTQAKVRKVFPRCTHALFDVAQDMSAARSAFRACFNDIGKRFPQHHETLVSEASRFMQLNNQVVLSIRCLPFWWMHAAGVAAVAAGALVLARRA
jgi:heme oxygenase